MSDTGIGRARALGTPGGSSTTTTCGTDVVGGDLECSLESMVLVRDDKGGKSTLSNVSRELLYVYADIDQDGTVERTPCSATLCRATTGTTTTGDSRSPSCASTSTRPPSTDTGP